MAFGESFSQASNVNKPFQQDELNTATFMLPTGMDLEEIHNRRGGGFSVVMPLTEYPQGIPMEPMRPLVYTSAGQGDTRGPDLIPQCVNLAEVVANYARDLIITQVAHPHEQREQPELWVPEGLGSTIVRALERKQFMYRAIGGNCPSMTLLDLVIYYGISQKLNFDWLFEKPSLELLCYKLGLKPWPSDCPGAPLSEEQDRWARIREEMHRSLRHAGDRGQRRPDDIRFSYAISQTALPTDEALDLLLLPLITIELYIKEQMPRDPNDRSFR